MMEIAEKAEYNKMRFLMGESMGEVVAKIIKL